jgi:hypothetical protein
MNLKFGDTIVFDIKLKRISNYTSPNAKKKFWEHIKIKPTTGIFLGWRLLSEGIVIIHYEDGPEYIPKNYMKVALIAYDPKKKSEYVPIHGIKLGEKNI